MTKWIWALVLARGIGVTSTCVALRQPGRIELNPLLPSACGSQIGLQVGLVALEGWGVHRLDKTHPKWARTLAAISISIDLSAATINLKGGVR